MDVDSMNTRNDQGGRQKFSQEQLKALKSKACFKCGRQGHITRNCQQNQELRQGGSRSWSGGTGSGYRPNQGQGLTVQVRAVEIPETNPYEEQMHTKMTKVFNNSKKTLEWVNTFLEDHHAAFAENIMKDFV